MAFHEVRFPEYISRGARGVPERRTQVVELTSGDEERNAGWAVSRRRYDVAYGIRVDGVAFGFTDHDAALTFDGTDFEPESGFAASEIRRRSGSGAFLPGHWWPHCRSGWRWAGWCKGSRLKTAPLPVAPGTG